MADTRTGYILSAALAMFTLACGGCNQDVSPAASGKTAETKTATAGSTTPSPEPSGQPIATERFDPFDSSICGGANFQWDRPGCMQSQRSEIADKYQDFFDASSTNACQVARVMRSTLWAPLKVRARRTLDARFNGDTPSGADCQGIAVPGN